MIFMMEGLTFGEHLKRARIAKKISQRELATKVGVDFTYLSKIENNRMAPPSEETIRKIADFLGESADSLILLANKIPSDYKEMLKSSDRVPLLFRKISNLSPEKQEQALEAINKIELED
jgi:transcriptional regulator with XRE-family HTH domain